MAEQQVMSRCDVYRTHVRRFIKNYLLKQQETQKNFDITLFQMTSLLTSDIISINHLVGQPKLSTAISKYLGIMSSDVEVKDILNFEQMAFLYESLEGIISYENHTELYERLATAERSIGVLVKEIRDIIQQTPELAGFHMSGRAMQQNISVPPNETVDAMNVEFAGFSSTIKKPVVNPAKMLVVPMKSRVVKPKPTLPSEVSQQAADTNISMEKIMEENKILKDAFRELRRRKAKGKRAIK